MYQLLISATTGINDYLSVAYRVNQVRWPDFWLTTDGFFDIVRCAHEGAILGEASLSLLVLCGDALMSWMQEHRRVS